MSAIEYIRRHVFGLSQALFAEIANVSQATVSRWEAGGLEPDREQMRSIRDEARRRGLPWQDDWFFDAPSQREDAA